MEIALIILGLVSFLMSVENTKLNRKLDECNKIETVYPLPTSKPIPDYKPDILREYTPVEMRDFNIKQTCPTYKHQNKHEKD